MNEKVNKFLLAGVKFLPEMHLRQHGFTYRKNLLFTKNHLLKTKKEHKNLKELEIEDTFIKMK